MKIVFLGFQKWGWAALKGLIESEHQVCLAVTHPQDKCTYQGSFLDKSVKELALAYKIPVIEARKIGKKEIINQLKKINPEVIISSDWETWIAPKVAQLASKAAINIHDALLPQYGGFSPVNWAIINGEKEAGITVHYIEEVFDQGKIILQEKVPIERDDTAADVLEKIFAKIPAVTLKSLNLIEAKKEAYRQDLSQASFYHKILPRDCQIDWRLCRQDIYNFIRALVDPFANAYTYFQDKQIKIKKASYPAKTYCGVPGRLVARLPRGVVVLGGKAGRNAPQGIVVEEIQDQQGKIWPANDYFSQLGCTFNHR